VPAYGIKTVNPFMDLDVPSGSTVQIRVLGVEDLVSMGIVEQFDTLGVLVQSEHVDRVKGTKKPSDRPKKKLTKAQQAAAEEQESDAAIMKLLADPAGFQNMQVLIDRVVAKSLVQPKVRLAYNEETVVSHDGSGAAQHKVKLVSHDETDLDKRDKGTIWTDQIEFADRMAIFAASMPDSDKMAPFRPGSKEGVGDMGDVAEDAMSPE
jgi:hypothetical protein